MLHELPCEKGKGERGSTPIDRRIDVDSFQGGQELTLLVVKGGQKSFTSQRAAIVLVLSGPIHFPPRQRRMRAFLTLWLPGTDHSSIGTQMVVERQLASKGRGRQKLGRGD